MVVLLVKVDFLSIKSTRLVRGNRKGVKNALHQDVK
jgi:hypothetical protein